MILKRCFIVTGLHRGHDQKYEKIPLFGGSQTGHLFLHVLTLFTRLTL